MVSSQVVELVERWYFCSFAGWYEAEKAHTPHYPSLRARAVPYYYDDFSQGLYIATMRQHFAIWFKKHGLAVPVPPISAETSQPVHAWKHVSLKMAEMREDKFMGYKHDGLSVGRFNGWQRHFDNGKWSLLPGFLLTERRGRRISDRARHTPAKEKGPKMAGCGQGEQDEAETSAAESSGGAKKGRRGVGKRERGQATSLGGFIVEDDAVQDEDESDEVVEETSRSGSKAKSRTKERCSAEGRGECFAPSHQRPLVSSPTRPTFSQSLPTHNNLLAQCTSEPCAAGTQSSRAPALL